MLMLQFSIQGPPKWLREPVDTSTSVGESVTLPCATFGYPTPDVIWRKANGNDPKICCNVCLFFNFILFEHFTDYLWLTLLNYKDNREFMHINMVNIYDVYYTWDV